MNNTWWLIVAGGTPYALVNAEEKRAAEAAGCTPQACTGECRLTRVRLAKDIHGRDVLLPMELPTTFHQANMFSDHRR